MTTWLFVLKECCGGYRGEDYSLIWHDVVEIGTLVVAHSMWYLRRLEFSMGLFTVYVILWETVLEDDHLEDEVRRKT